MESRPLPRLLVKISPENRIIASTATRITSPAVLDALRFRFDTASRLTVTGSDDGELIITDRATQFSLGDGALSIIVNTPIQECYTGMNALCNERMVGDFPILTPGVNHILLTGGISEVQIQPNWRFL